MKKILNKKFYNRDTKIVAKELLGKFLVRKFRNKLISEMITDVEVYDGFKDLASHARNGMTRRNALMFQSPGKWYVYLVYGLHNMLNIVTREIGYPAAILIRGIKDKNGPGTVTKIFKIDKTFNGKNAAKTTGLYIEDRGVKIPNKFIRKTKRIGISYAGNIWTNKNLRYFIN